VLVYTHLKTSFCSLSLEIPDQTPGLESLFDLGFSSFYGKLDVTSGSEHTNKP